MTALDELLKEIITERRIEAESAAEHYRAEPTMEHQERMQITASAVQLLTQYRTTKREKGLSL